MTGDSLSRNYLIKVRIRLKALGLYFAEEDYSDVVREAQEVVELCAKGMLRAVGIDPPRQHDVGPLLLLNRDRFPDAVRPELDALAAASKELRKEREFSFYGDDDFLPVEEYKREDGERAMRAAESAVRLAGLVIRD
jgi:HEPN domain-containing protein